MATRPRIPVPSKRPGHVSPYQIGSEGGKRKEWPTDETVMPNIIESLRSYGINLPSSTENDEPTNPSGSRPESGK
jgi:hypothetical protein